MILPVLIILLFGINMNAQSNSVLEKKIICIDPGHGGTAKTDTFRVGPTGEREEWINLRVSIYLQKLLEENGAVVIMTRTEDIHIPLQERAEIAKKEKADLFISIHHNATADTNVNFPIVYYHGNALENRASVRLAEIVALNVKQFMFEYDTPYSVVSDHTIFPSNGTAVLRHTYGIPGIIVEASFFTNRDEESRLKDSSYNLLEAKALYESIVEFFSEEITFIIEKNSIVNIDPFAVLQEAERMDESALKWKENYYTALDLFNYGNEESLKKAYELFTLSAKSFPDSYLAGNCHLYRSKILYRIGEFEKGEMELMRVKEFYPLAGYDD